MFKGLLRIWQNYDPAVAKCFTIGQVLTAVDGQIL